MNESTPYHTSSGIFKTPPNLRLALFLCLTVPESVVSIANGASVITADTGLASLGTVITADSPNQQYLIDNGTQLGSNLYHSFNRFTLDTNDTALFRGNSSLQNVFARVTGGFPSVIDGRLKLDDNIRSSNLFFLNPAGISFNEHASLDLDGSFYATTADFIDFADSNRFYAKATPNNSVLTVAAPEAFGFLSASPFPGTINISGSHLQVAQGESLAFVSQVGSLSIFQQTLRISNSLRVNSGYFDAPEGLVSFAELDAGQPFFIDEANATGTSTATPGADFNQQQDIYIRSGRLVIDNAHIGETGILSNNFGGAIDVAVSDDVTVSNEGRLSSKSNNAHINIEAGSVRLNDQAKILLTPGATDTAPGQIGINVDQLVLNDESTISNSTSSGVSQAGSIAIDASQRVEINHSARILSITTGSGDAGDIDLRTGELTMTGGIVSADSETGGTAGNIVIKAERIDLQKDAKITSSATSTGNSGNIVIQNARSIDIKGNIATDTQRLSADAGDAGHITIAAKEGIAISDDGAVSSRSEGAGHAGTITIKTSELRLNNGRITTEASRSDGGDITIEGNSPAKLVSLQNNSAITATVGGGPQTTGGNIDINADLVVAQNSVIIAEANLGTGGNINIHSQGLFLDTDSRISASSRFGVDGTVEIDSVTEVIEGALGLPENYLSVVNLRQETCAQRYSANKASSFTVMNKAGLPYNPELLFSGSDALTPKFAILDSLSNHQVSSLMTAAAKCARPAAHL